MEQNNTLVSAFLGIDLNIAYITESANTKPLVALVNHGSEKALSSMLLRCYNVNPRLVWWNGHILYED